jgi:hypothetical protein
VGDLLSRVVLDRLLQEKRVGGGEKIKKGKERREKKGKEGEK